MVDNNSTWSTLTLEQQFDLFIHHYAEIYNLQIKPDSTISNFQYTVQHPEDSNHTLLLEYNRSKEELNIHALKINMECTLKISENEFQNELDELHFGIFLKKIITLVVDKNAGNKYNVNLELLVEEFENSRKIDQIHLDLFYMLCGTVMGFTVYKKLLNS